MKLKVVSPILGFEAIKNIDIESVDQYFSILRSDEISFTVIDPLAIRDYDIVIPDSYSSLLELDDDTDISIYSIVIMQNPIEKSYINFLAPIIVNNDKKLLAQVALDGDKYPQYGLCESISKYL
jgi:flagellar assembly factor FliW